MRRIILGALWAAAALCGPAWSQSSPFSTTVTVYWIAPTQNSDQTPLTDLDHYTVYQGADATHLVSVKSIPAGTLTYTTPGLFSGTYYFAISATNARGVESQLTVAAPAKVVAPIEPPAKTPNPPGAPRTVVNPPPKPA